MRWKSLILGLCGACLPALPGLAVDLGPFDQALYQYTQDGALDGQEYAWLRQLGGQSLPDQDRALARHFLSFAGKYTGFIHMSYSYYRSGSQIRLSFVFAPTYAENSVIEGRSSRELLGQISQNDVLPTTQADAERCGAAALLSAHYLLYGSFDEAFARLNIQAQGLTYRSIHQAQEALYQQANSDGKSGLVSMFRYTLYTDGRVDKPVAEGEIKDAAHLVKLKVQPVIGPRKERFNQRQQAVQAFWRLYPEAAFLVGVHLDEKTGRIWAPTERAGQNHFVLIFRQNNSVWLLNSGVLDNGNSKALQALSPRQVQDMLYHTEGSVDAVTRE